MSLDSPSASLGVPSDVVSFPRELHLSVLTFLRATDLSALQRTCRCFNNRDLITAVVDRCANEVVSASVVCTCLNASSLRMQSIFGEFIGRVLIRICSDALTNPFSPSKYF